MQIEFDDKNLFTEPIYQKIQKESFTATRFGVITKDPIRFKKQYVLGVPEILLPEEEFRVTNFDDEEFEGSASERGIFIHYLFENIKKWVDDNYEIIPEEIEKLCNHYFDKELFDEDIDHYIQILSKVIDTNLLRENLKYKDQFRNELQLKMPYDDDFLVGYIDLYFEKDNEIEIWDWKTNKLKGEADIPRTAEFYVHQMELYSYLALKYSPDKESVNARLLFTELAGNEKADEQWTHSIKINKTEIKDIDSVLPLIPIIL